MVGIVCSREEIKVGVAVLSLGGGKKDGRRRGGRGARGGRGLILERRMGRRRVVYDI
jgi:hypothetical protein